MPRPFTPSSGGPPGLAAVAAAAGALLRADAVGEPSGVVVAAGGRVRRLGLALDGTAEVGRWAVASGLDALLLHRSWGFAPPEGLGVLAYHAAFDATYALHGPLVAAALGVTGHRLVGPKLAVAEGLPGVRQRVRALFGGDEDWRPGGAAGRLALASALSPALVERAAAEGAGLYVTGQWRPSAREAVARTGLTVGVVGHRRAEAWALRHLAGSLSAALPGVDVRVFAG